MEAAIASAILKVAGEKLISLLDSEFAAITGVERDLKRLQGIHGEITSWLSVICDLSIEKDPRFGWIIQLKDVAYDVDDLLYEVHLESEKHKIANDSGQHAMADYLCAKPTSFWYRCKVAQKIKAIKVKLVAIGKQRSGMDAIGHNIPLSQPIMSKNRGNVELSLLTNVEESQIPTRDKEKVSIISTLLQSNEGQHGWIVSVVGLGGSGKTTLAKHICHHNKIKEHFKDKIYWVHVSQEFDLKNLVAKVFEAITKERSDLHTPQHLVDQILGKLTFEKYLLVLDDAWHQEKDDWNKLMVNLRSCTAGSKVLVTTRDQKVAEAVKSDHIFNLAHLSYDESWSLFLKNSGLEEEDLGSEFVKFGKEAVKKCGGVPLAIKTLGGILSEKREISTWRAISQSDLWNEENTEGRVFASLKLSYIHLNDNLKQCFTYCSIFPKGYRINKSNLIEQWIVHGFLKQTMGQKHEVIGSDNFDSLVKVGFLQDPVNSLHGSGVEYMMHDLIHDLTRYILQSEVVTCPLKNGTKGCTQKCRYLSLTSCGFERVFFDKVRALYIFEANPSLDKQVKKSRYLCSVVLECAHFTPLPLFILKLEYLGYLEIHNFPCIELPEAISGCWNLQSLHFISCFVTLPESIGNLKKLRTLELTCTDLESLPQSIGDCKNLESLQISSCEKFREIPKTIGKNENLRVLQIVKCRNFQQQPSEFIGKFKNLKTINLAGCKSLKDLPSAFYSCALRTLNLSETGVTKLPEWVTSISTLECIDLEDCCDLEELPRGIGNLKRLEFLNLKGCRFWNCMPSGFAQLTCLKRLDLFVVGRGGDDARISDLENLDIISGKIRLTNLPHLMDSSDAQKACLKKKKHLRNLELCWPESVKEEESISNCGVLDDFGPHSEIEEFCITGYRHFSCWTDMQRYLELCWPESVKEEESISNCGVLDDLEPPSEIEELSITGYRGSHLPCWMSMQSDSSCLESAMLNQSSQPRFHYLIKLNLFLLPNLKHMRGIRELPSLKSLELCSMPNLEELWTTTTRCGFGIGEEKEVGEQYCFPTLSHLAINCCPKLIVEPYFPPSLESLQLGFCNSQLRCPGRSFFRLLPPHVDEPSSSSRAFAKVPPLKRLSLIGMTWSASDFGFLQHQARLESLALYASEDLTLTELPSSMRGLTSLKTLNINGCTSLGALPEWLGELRSLREIDISRCPMISSLPQSIEQLTSLTSLRISGSGNLKQLPDAIQHLTSLRSLKLSHCSALIGLPEGIGKLSALVFLYIINCPALQSLPSSIRCLNSNTILRIRGCPELARRYKKDVGDDWHLISHLCAVDIGDTIHLLD